MLTVRGVGFLAAAAAAWATARTLGVDELYVVTVALVAVVLIGAGLVRLGTGHIAVRRELGVSRLLYGQRAEVLLEIRADGGLPIPLLRVEDLRPPALMDADDEARAARFAVSSLVPRRVRGLRHEIVGSRRGRHAVGPATVRVRDPFGLVERVRRFTSTDEVLVYPEVEELDEGGVRGVHRGSGTSTLRRLLIAGDEFHTMRPYADGDDLRRVHWPTTARRGEMMVRQHEEPWEARAILLCDTRTKAHGGYRASSTLERGISATASILWHLADRGYDLTLITDTDRGDPQPRPWPELLDRLAEVEGSTEASLGPACAPLRSRVDGGLFVAVVAPPPPGEGPVATHPDVRALVSAGRGASARIGVVCSPPGPSSDRAIELAILLRAARWRVTELHPGERLAPSWANLAARRPASGVRKS